MAAYDAITDPVLRQRTQQQATITNQAAYRAGLTGAGGTEHGSALLWGLLQTIPGDATKTFQQQADEIARSLQLNAAMIRAQPGHTGLGSQSSEAVYKLAASRTAQEHGSKVGAAGIQRAFNRFPLERALDSRAEAVSAGLRGTIIAVAGSVLGLAVLGPAIGAAAGVGGAEAAGAGAAGAGAASRVSSTAGGATVTRTASAGAAGAGATTAAEAGVAGGVSGGAASGLGSALTGLAIKGAFVTGIVALIDGYGLRTLQVLGGGALLMFGLVTLAKAGNTPGVGGLAKAATVAAVA